MSGILGKKIGMTQIFEDGKFVSVTVVEAGPNFVLQKKTEEKDGYVALQLGFDEKKEKNTTKPLMGIFNKAGVKPQRFVKELEVESVDGYELGQEIKVDVLAKVQYVDHGHFEPHRPAAPERKGRPAPEGVQRGQTLRPQSSAVTEPSGLQAPRCRADRPFPCPSESGELFTWDIGPLS